MSIPRSLGDKLYEKRKAGALEVEKTVRELGNNFSEIERIVAKLNEDFIRSNLPNMRNGGLIALAACAIALGPKVSVLLPQIVAPILTCFLDHDPRVRYYALESLYNVSKVARQDILVYFNEIFDALSRLSVDVELSVKNGAELLDRLIKDIVCEKSVYYHAPKDDVAGNPTNLIQAEENSKSVESQSVPHPMKPIALVPGTQPLRQIAPNQFNIPRFIPLLQERIKIQAPVGRIFLVQWLFVLNSVPDLELITYLPEFLDGLFAFLCDQNTDVRTTTLNMLGEFLREIKVEDETRFIKRPSNSARDAPESEGDSRHLIRSKAYQLDFGKMTDILVKYAASSDVETQRTALRWILEFLQISRNSVILPKTASLLSCIIPTLSHADSNIYSLAQQCNMKLFELVLSEGQNVDSSSTISTLTLLFKDQRQATRVGTLEWLIMLHKTFSKQAIDADVNLHQGLLSTLSDFNEEVAKRALQLLSQIAMNSYESFGWLMASLIELFAGDRQLLETKGNLIIRQLSLLLEPEKMYKCFAKILESSSDLEFASLMVQNLNLILITAPEFSDIRLLLRNPDRDLFVTLFKSWCHNSVSLLSLALLAQQYDLASLMLTPISEQISVSTLIQIDKLVQLLESPVFTPLRLQLLEPDRYPGLYKSMYGILMLLPQSSAFATLRNRLTSVNTIALMQFKPPSKEKIGANIKSGTQLSANDLLLIFQQVQKMHSVKHQSVSIQQQPNKKVATRRSANNLLGGTSGGSSKG